MSGERIARVLVGVGFLWVTLILAVGMLGGLDIPSVWVQWLAAVSGWPVLWHAYLGLAWVVVPLGMLVYLRDVFADPSAPWVKAAAPGALTALYCLFLAAAWPAGGRKALLWVESVVPLAGVSTDPEATWGWFLRFLVLLALLAGLPGLAGAAAGLLASLGGRRRR